MSNYMPWQPRCRGGRIPRKLKRRVKLFVPVWLWKANTAAYKNPFHDQERVQQQISNGLALRGVASYLGYGFNVTWTPGY